MSEKQFTQEELNRIVAARLKRERERLTREFENKLKRCMAAVHMTLYREMCSLKWEIAAEARDPLWSATVSFGFLLSQGSAAYTTVFPIININKKALTTPNIFFNFLCINVTSPCCKSYS